MKKIVYFLSFILIFLSCSSGYKVMTADEFSQISINQSIQDIEKKYGKPFSIKKISDNEIEYLYIERLSTGGRVLQERHYLILFRNGKVSSTQTRFYNRPSYEGNSYEMQTTFREEDKQDREQLNK